MNFKLALSCYTTIYINQSPSSLRRYDGENGEVAELVDAQCTINIGLSEKYSRLAYSSREV